MENFMKYFFPEIRNKTRCPRSPFLLHGGLDVIARVVRDGNKRDTARKRGQRILTVDEWIYIWDPRLHQKTHTADTHLTYQWQPYWEWNQCPLLSSTGTSHKWYTYTHAGKTCNTYKISRSKKFSTSLRVHLTRARTIMNKKTDDNKS